MVITCNNQLSPPPHDQYYGTSVSGLENSLTPQQITQNNIHSSQFQPIIDQTNQIDSDFSPFWTSHARLVEELKNLDEYFSR